MRALFSVLIPILMGSQAFAKPAEIVLIRHAEKPKDGNELSEDGQKRAQLLVGFLSQNREINKNGPIAVVYAMGQSEVTKSIRAIQTVQPFVDATQTPLITEYKKKKYLEMIQNIMNNPEYDHKTVLICWEHKVLNEIAEGFGIDPKPAAWGKDVYNLVWIIDLKHKQPKMKVIPQIFSAL